MNKFGSALLLAGYGATALTFAPDLAQMAARAKARLFPAFPGVRLTFRDRRAASMEPCYWATTCFEVAPDLARAQDFGVAEQRLGAP